MLAALYTDSTTYSFVGRLACLLKKSGVDYPRLNAFVSRKLEGIPAGKVHSFDNFLDLPWGGLHSKYRRSGLQGADVVYSMCGEEFRFLRWAKEQGCRIVVDIFVHPGTDRIIKNEAVHYCGKCRVAEAHIVDQENHFRRSFEIADIILCPSSWVAEGVREYGAEHSRKIRIVPYGSSLPRRTGINENPVKGRVLFAGRDPLRKGLHYLAEAARMLRESGMDIDVRVAGLSQADVDWIPDCGELNCLGNVPMDQMHHEFEQAEVFVLPSLSEGQAGVVLESMACGCPVIATRESGVDFMGGCGITVPARDAKALADAIMYVVKDRSTRNALARGALRQSAHFSVDVWKARLVEIANEACS
jgi:glycosyltransferase involved in cell wall biosynthesis